MLYRERKSHLFAAADVTRERLPRADALLSRNTLTHLSNEVVARALRLFKQSEARYLFATTSPGADNADIQAGGWRRVDLTRPPFSLPPPLALLEDGPPANRSFLGVWRLADC